ncbi:uncharacterized protein LOC129583095 [Paramacrobiotus metropolitanus]|uniref:uncharacterized protein LOC129583095 n=1 Tax=Paramacrobiotus metropolitanus TaxID=2943436 RepID=UPI002445FD60|nr:uncharacterized protein LOC129583095 [Paramacrobiotus metropolitanus]
MLPTCLLLVRIMMERRSCRPGNAADAASDIIMRLAYHILTLGFFIIIDVDGCPRQSTPIERAEMAVREAEAKMTDRVIILPSFEDSTVPAENVRRVPLGSTVTFACNVTTSSGSAATQVIWRHRNKTVRANETAQNNIGYFYRLQNTANTSLLSIHNATRATAGTVECLRPCSGRDLCLIEDYELRLQYRVQEVFGPAMRNVSTPCGNSP